MSEAVIDPAGGVEPAGKPGVKHDFSQDKQVFPVPWGKAMMWIFLLSDTFIFSCFLVSYMKVRIATTDPWPFPSEVFALTLFGHSIPLVLIAIMTFILITSSGTMALALGQSLWCRPVWLKLFHDHWLSWHACVGRCYLPARNCFSRQAGFLRTTWRKL